MRSSSNCRQPDTADRLCRGIRNHAAVELSAAAKWILVALALFAGIATLACSFSQGILAQSKKGSIRAVVEDPSGALVSGAHLLSSNSQKTRDAITGSDGNILISDLDVGFYRLTVTAPGFAIWRREKIPARDTCNMGWSRIYPFLDCEWSGAEEFEPPTLCSQSRSGRLLKFIEICRN